MELSGGNGTGQYPKAIQYPCYYVTWSKIKLSNFGYEGDYFRFLVHTESKKVNDLEAASKSCIPIFTSIIHKHLTLLSSASGGQLELSEHKLPK